MDDTTKKTMDMISIMSGKEYTENDTSLVKSQLKLFLLSQAQREAYKLEKMTSALDKMQNRYIERSIQYMEEHDDDTAIVYLPEMIKNITEYLKYSGSTIKSVVSDDKLFDMVCFNTQNNTIMVNNGINSVDIDSRRKIRDTVKNILQAMSDENIVIADNDNTYNEEEDKSSNNKDNSINI